MAAAVPNPFADRYIIRRPLGSGGFGAVVEAFDTHQNMDVALKLFRPGSPVIHAYNEASILTALEGEHILRVYNADTFLDFPYVATAIAPMGSAEDWLGHQTLGLSPDIVLTWARHVLVGLGSCHERGLLHRDVKPANVFPDSVDWARLGDFGIAHPMDAGGYAIAGGDPVIVAPEMYVDGRGTVRSDLWSVGVTMYRLLTGTWPFDGADVAVVEAAVRRGTFLRLRDAAPHVSRRLSDRVERALSADPSARFGSWREMHLALGQSGLVKRAWVRITSHVGHTMCWEETGRGTPRYRVCALDRGGSMDIETGRLTGARGRALRHCGTSIHRTRLLTELRRVFDHL